ncbi:hypothetical protein P153DRAFT_188839 [Dothidotthia symphoricarpi CBS 119687]|uniref:Alpha/beta-hydrolase n=1 Tax=Dothidotthia symphoricarpi CBS 119687 TaxID=1392245 RepID=A0A6A6AKH9_9PLEO|nr:uncharacterized protein P153DRAFT_188839 [Dothidotthia symphoricarpi CBS 119687]KAF2132320.1 hypothetical protein P153DRAFT_188839 [Dothidotthia symphoricarpi CBS 119687]
MCCAEGQVQPFWLDTSDGEKLFCWHVLPLDVYLQHESELVTGGTTGEVAEELKGTVGARLLGKDEGGRVVVNFHGNAGHIAQGHRPSTYRSISGIPHTHLITCDYRGFGLSTLKNAPHIPTETGIITDAISLLTYIETTLQHPQSRTVLLGQSLGTAVTAASALWAADATSSSLPPSLQAAKSTPQSSQGFAGLVLVAPFTDLKSLLQTYKVFGIFPVLRPLRGYPRIANYLATKIVDEWPTLARLKALLASPVHRIRLTILHARNDQDIDFRESEALYAPLQSGMLAGEGASTTEERRSIHGGERVRRGAFAYNKAESAGGDRVVELEVLRYGGHNAVVGWSQVSLAVRRAFESV